MSSPPTVSVIVPTYDSARYVGETLESVLGQTRPADEVIVVDDGSTDETIAVASGFEPAVRVLRFDHAGTSANRQRGYEATTGDLVANCDSDDLWLPTKLERQVALLEARPDLHLVGCLVDEFLSPDADESAIPGRGMRSAAPSCGATAQLVRRTFLDEIGGFRNRRELGEFAEWYANALTHGLRADVVDEVLVRRRLHERNSSRVFETQSGEYLTIVRELLARKREAEG